MGTLARRGRDKLTLITSPAVSSFGLWVEQLIAESTGKEGKGIIPVAGEPLLEPTYYGDDRLFIYLRLEDDDNSAIDAAVAGFKSSGQPVLVIEMRDRYALGTEFFRWEFATAVAGAILGINPFNQPNVQATKEATERVLQEYLTSGGLPLVEAAHSLAGLLAYAGRGEYLAVMAYLHQTPEVDRAFSDLRRKVVERYHIATTFGYGPRFLHSAGQLHKGGANEGVFIQFLCEDPVDAPVPDSMYTFSVLKAAQALGDYQALVQRQRRAVRVNLGNNIEAGLKKTLEILAGKPAPGRKAAKRRQSSAR